MNDKQHLAALFAEYNEKGRDDFNSNLAKHFSDKGKEEELNEIKGILSDSSFLEKLKKFDLDRLSVLDNHLMFKLRGEFDKQLVNDFRTRTIAGGLSENKRVLVLNTVCGHSSTPDQVLGEGYPGKFHFDGFVQGIRLPGKIETPNAVVSPVYHFDLEGTDLFNTIHALPKTRKPRDLLNIKRMGELEKQSFQPKTKPWIHKRK